MTDQRRTTHEELDCTLTADEIQARGELLAKTENEAAKLIEERTAARQMFNSKLKEKEVEIARLATDIERKQEKRKVQCEIQVDHKRSMKTIIRLDTNETVREEVLGLREIEEARQPDLFPAEKAPEGETAPKGEASTGTPPKICGMLDCESTEGLVTCGDGVSRCVKHTSEYVDAQLDAETGDAPKPAAPAEEPKPKRKRRAGGEA